MNNQLTFYTDSAEAWERALYAFLGEKQRRSGSLRTVESYSRMLPALLRQAGQGA